MRAFGALTWVELKLFAREPLTVVFVLVLPVVVLYVLNGVFGSQPADPSVWEGLGAVDFYTPSYVALVAATAGVLSMPVHLASYREQGVLRRFRATALRPSTLVGAHMAVTAMAATVGAAIVTGVSVVAYDAAPPRHWLSLIPAYVLVVGAFAALGAALGLLIPTARAAQGIGVLLFFVFLMLGGAGPPREVLPGALAAVSDLVPVTYAGRLLRGPWFGGQGVLGSAAVLIGLVSLCLALVAWQLRRDTRR
jgi:ABC-2 type transport system permease protein